MFGILRPLGCFPVVESDHRDRPPLRCLFRTGKPNRRLPDLCTCECGENRDDHVKLGGTADQRRRHSSHQVFLLEGSCPTGRCLGTVAGNGRHLDDWLGSGHALRSRRVVACILMKVGPADGRLRDVGEVGVRKALYITCSSAQLDRLALELRERTVRLFRWRESRLSFESSDAVAVVMEGGFLRLGGQRNGSWDLEVEFALRVP